MVEDLILVNMLRRAKPVPDPDNPGQFLKNGARATSGLSRSISDAGWGRFLSVLRAKAEEAGVSGLRSTPGTRPMAARSVGTQHRRIASRKRNSVAPHAVRTDAGRRTRRTQPLTGWTGPSRARRVRRSRRLPSRRRSHCSFDAIPLGYRRSSSEERPHLP